MIVHFVDTCIGGCKPPLLKFFFHIVEYILVQHCVWWFISNILHGHHQIGFRM